jgi:hypothetical protein
MTTSENAAGTEVTVRIRDSRNGELEIVSLTPPLSGEEGLGNFSQKDIDEVVRQHPESDSDMLRQGIEAFRKLSPEAKQRYLAAMERQLAADAALAELNGIEVEQPSQATKA